MTTTQDTPKTTYKYHFKNRANRVVQRNITHDLERREKEHQVRWPDGHIVQIGRRTTMAQAKKWVKAGGRAGKPRQHKNDKQATKADLKVEVGRLTTAMEVLTKLEATLGQENKDLVEELEGVIKERDAKGRPAALTHMGQSGSPWWLYRWHTSRFLRGMRPAHSSECDTATFVDPTGRYFNYWNCKKGG